MKVRKTSAAAAALLAASWLAIGAPSAFAEETPEVTTYEVPAEDAPDGTLLGEEAPVDETPVAIEDEPVDTSLGEEAPVENNGIAPEERSVDAELMAASGAAPEAATTETETSSGKQIGGIALALAAGGAIVIALRRRPQPAKDVTSAE